MDFTENEINLICEYVSPKERKQKAKYMYQIVANVDSGLDCDKIDYLIRDPKGTGTTVSFNYKLLLERACVVDGDICYPHDDYLDIYKMFEARYYMHKGVYQHSTIKTLDHMITDMLYDLDMRHDIANKIDDIEAFCKCTDSIIDIDMYMYQDTVVSSLMNRIYCRDLYKVIYKSHIVDELMIEQLLSHINDDTNNVIVDVSNINYNSKSSNPLSHICFYNRKTSRNRKFKSSQHDMIMPTTFNETMTLIILKQYDEELEKKIITFIRDYEMER